MSAKTNDPNAYIAIGFQNQFPFMQGADIVMGFMTSSNQVCCATVALGMAVRPTLCSCSCCVVCVIGLRRADVLLEARGHA
jgi:hypothetical protein